MFLLIATGMGSWSWKLARRQQALRDAPPAPASAPEGNAEASWNALQPVDTLGLEAGYRLIAMVDKARAGDLLQRIKGVRKKKPLMTLMKRMRALRRLPVTEVDISPAPS